jgi:CheY-like chemotaxis protein
MKTLFNTRHNVQQPEPDAGRSSLNPEELCCLMPERFKILIAEDDKTAQAFYDECLSEQEFEKRIIASGKEALETYQEWQPDIVVLDIMLQEMTGYTILKEIRSSGDKFTTIIMATCMSGKSDVLDCFKLGIQGYIVKPFDAHTLREKILQCHRNGIC